MKWPQFYFPWLQRDNPTGLVEIFPELTQGGETSVKGLYCIGDLTGVPLINLAAASGRKVVQQLNTDAGFQKERNAVDKSVLDIIIIGAGPAGICAAMEAQQKGYRFEVLEASRPFLTIANFPAQKPIHIVDAPDGQSPLSFTADAKETLLQDLIEQTDAAALPIRCDQNVGRITKDQNCFVVESNGATRRALRVIVAIGKSGNPRKLKVPGEDAPHVFSRLIDASAFANQQILVIGGGDTAVEGAIALAQHSNHVTFSYRKDSLTRPKPNNIEIFNRHVENDQITPLFESDVLSIDENSATLTTVDGEKKVSADAVLILIGTELPFSFFERSNIRLENVRTLYDKLVLAALILFSCVLYFGKSGPTTPVNSWWELFTVPSQLSELPWHKGIKGWMAWLSLFGLGVTGIAVGLAQWKEKRWAQNPWEIFKHGYFGAMAILFSYLYVSSNLLGTKLLGQSTGAWYTAMYSLTIVIFGFRRMKMKPTAYIKKQTWTLMMVQVFPLFLLPLFILPWMGQHGWLSDWVMTHVFPNESYWRAFGFILGWPLFLYNLASGQPYLFWLVFSIIQTFVIIPYLVYRYGKGAYCGWICSCGALAETLGDEYRTKAPHGPKAKKWENAGQVVLWFAAVVTIFALLKTWFGISIPHSSTATRVYAIVVDIIFAGVLGVGVYFTYSGRIWCRFLCPLAALMHLYARSSLYRIFAQKEKCISCGICTKVCHMGIDVMGFAAKGAPMNDVECVRCSACIVNCPMDVLSFGTQPKSDPHNKLYQLQPKA